MTERQVTGIALVLCIIAGLYAWAVYGDAPDLTPRASQPEWWDEAPRRPVSRPQARTLTVMGGEVIWYQVVELYGSRALVLRLEMTLDDYEAAGRLGRACDGCRLRVYVVKERRK